MPLSISYFYFVVLVDVGQQRTFVDIVTKLQAS